MAKAVRGTKRHCRNCGAKFYDLGRDPIVCPLCQTEYALEAPAPTRAAAAKAAAVEEEVAAPAAAAAAPEFISLEEAEEKPVAGVAIEDEEDIDLGDADEALPEGEDEDVFLEEEEEDESDVSGFVGGPEEET